MISVIDFPNHNVVKWHFDAADWIFEPLCSNKFTYADGKILYRFIFGVTSYLEPHLHCCFRVNRNSSIGNGNLTSFPLFKFDESIKEFLDNKLISPWEGIETIDDDDNEVSWIWKGDMKIFPSSLS